MSFPQPNPATMNNNRAQLANSNTTEIRASVEIDEKPAYGTLSECAEHLDGLFDELTLGIQSERQSDVAASMHRLGTTVATCHASLRHDDWQRLIAIARQHPFFNLVLQEPMTRRSFLKPRSYPGDAELIDFLYGSDVCRHEIESAPPTGQRIFLFNWMTPAALAVRNRCRIIADSIGHTLARNNSPRILSIAAGHLREAGMVLWDRANHLELFLVTDQDMESLAMVERNEHHPHQRCRQLTIQQIIRGQLPEQDFDLIYATGLYDYLSDKVAMKLTQILFEKLRSGGKLLIPNFKTTTADIGYMEMFMDWHLIFRNEEQMSKLMSAVPSERLAGSRLFMEDAGQICFAEMVRY